MISPQATSIAAKYLQVPGNEFMGALGAAVSANPTVSLVELITANKLLTRELQRKEAAEAMQMARQGAGLPGLLPQQTTIAQQVAEALAASNKDLELEVMGSAAQPDREGGIAGLDAGELGQDYANGGIVAFEDGGDVRRFDSGGAVDAARARRDAAQQTLYTYGLRQRRDNPQGFMAAQNEFSVAQQAVAAAEAVYAAEMSGTGITRAATAPRDVGATKQFSTLPAVAPAVAPAAPAAPAEAVGDPVTQGNLGGGAAPAGDAAPAGGAAPDPRNEDSEFRKIMKSLENQQTQGISLLGGRRGKEKILSAKEYADANLKAQNEFLKARGLPTAEESMKSRVDALASQAVQARENRDTDRLLALAQGFFAMGAGQSQYAMVNMAQGLGVTTKELKSVEQEYRKGEQLRKDKTELLQEATRQEAIGNFAKGDALRNEAQIRNDKLDGLNTTIAGKLLTHSTAAQANLLTRQGQIEQRRDAAQANLLTRQAQIEQRRAAAEIMQEEARRRNREAEALRRDKFELEARIKDVDSKAHEEISRQINALGPRESLKPREQLKYDGLVTQYNNLGRAIDARVKAIVNKRIDEDSSLRAKADAIVLGRK